MIAKLVDKWRDTSDHDLYTTLDADYWIGLNTAYGAAADALEAALPKWAKFTDDKEPWPDDGDIMIAYKHPIDDKWCIESWVFDGDLTHLDGCYWRSACDLDYPPEGS